MVDYFFDIKDMKMILTIISFVVSFVMNANGLYNFLTSPMSKRLRFRDYVYRLWFDDLADSMYDDNLKIEGGLYCNPFKQCSVKCKHHNVLMRSFSEVDPFRIALPEKNGIRCRFVVEPQSPAVISLSEMGEEIYHQGDGKTPIHYYCESTKKMREMFLLGKEGCSFTYNISFFETELVLNYLIEMEEMEVSMVKPNCSVDTKRYSCKFKSYLESVKFFEYISFSDRKCCFVIQQYWQYRNSARLHGCSLDVIMKHIISGRGFKYSDRIYGEKCVEGESKESLKVIDECIMSLKFGEISKFLVKYLEIYHSSYKEKVLFLLSSRESWPRKTPLIPNWKMKRIGVDISYICEFCKYVSLCGSDKTVRPTMSVQYFCNANKGEMSKINLKSLIPVRRHSMNETALASELDTVDKSRDLMIKKRDEVSELKSRGLFKKGEKRSKRKVRIAMVESNYFFNRGEGIDEVWRERVSLKKDPFGYARRALKIEVLSKFVLPSRIGKTPEVFKMSVLPIKDKIANFIECRNAQEEKKEGKKTQSEDFISVSKGKKAKREMGKDLMGSLNEKLNYYSCLFGGKENETTIKKDELSSFRKKKKSKIDKERCKGSLELNIKMGETILSNLRQKKMKNARKCVRSYKKIKEFFAKNGKEEEFLTETVFEMMEEEFSHRKERRENRSKRSPEDRYLMSKEKIKEILDKVDAMSKKKREEEEMKKRMGIDDRSEAEKEEMRKIDEGRERSLRLIAQRREERERMEKERIENERLEEERLKRIKLMEEKEKERIKEGGKNLIEITVVDGKVKYWFNKRNYTQTKLLSLCNEEEKMEFERLFKEMKIRELMDEKKNKGTKKYRPPKNREWENLGEGPFYC
jgi:hypothetical protein